MTEPADDADREPVAAVTSSPKPEPDAPGDAPQPGQSPVVLSGEVPSPVSPMDPPAIAARKVMWTHVARLLDLSIKTVEAQLTIAVRRIAQALGR